MLRTHSPTNGHRRPYPTGGQGLLIVADPLPSQREFLKVEEVAALLKIKEKTVREWIGRGELEAYKIGKEWRVRRDHLDAAIEARRVGAQVAPPGGLWDPADPDER
jgi:excisionase family DNA binding protein